MMHLSRLESCQQKFHLLQARVQENWKHRKVQILTGTAIGVAGAVAAVILWPIAAAAAAVGAAILLHGTFRAPPIKAQPQPIPPPPPTPRPVVPLPVPVPDPIPPPSPIILPRPIEPPPAPPIPHLPPRLTNSQLVIQFYRERFASPPDRSTPEMEFAVYDILGYVKDCHIQGVEFLLRQFREDYPENFFAVAKGVSLLAERLRKNTKNTKHQNQLLQIQSLARSFWRGCKKEELVFKPSPPDAPPAFLPPETEPPIWKKALVSWLLFSAPLLSLLPKNPPTEPEAEVEMPPEWLIAGKAPAADPLLEHLWQEYSSCNLPSPPAENPLVRIPLPSGTCPEPLSRKALVPWAPIIERPCIPDDFDLIQPPFQPPRFSLKKLPLDPLPQTTCSNETRPLELTCSFAEKPWMFSAKDLLQETIETALAFGHRVRARISRDLTQSWSRAQHMADNVQDRAQRAVDAASALGNGAARIGARISRDLAQSWSRAQHMADNVQDRAQRAVDAASALGSGAARVGARISRDLAQSWSRAQHMADNVQDRAQRAVDAASALGNGAARIGARIGRDLTQSWSRAQHMAGDVLDGTGRLGIGLGRYAMRQSWEQMQRATTNLQHAPRRILNGAQTTFHGIERVVSRIGQDLGRTWDLALDDNTWSGVTGTFSTVTAGLSRVVNGTVGIWKTIISSSLFSQSPSQSLPSPNLEQTPAHTARLQLPAPLPRLRQPRFQNISTQHVQTSAMQPAQRLLLLAPPPRLEQPRFQNISTQHVHTPAMQPAQRPLLPAPLPRPEQPRFQNISTQRVQTSAIQPAQRPLLLAPPPRLEQPHFQNISTQRVQTSAMQPAQRPLLPAPPPRLEQPRFQNISTQHVQTSAMQPAQRLLPAPPPRLEQAPAAEIVPPNTSQSQIPPYKESSHFFGKFFTGLATTFGILGYLKWFTRRNEEQPPEEAHHVDEGEVQLESDEEQEQKRNSRGPIGPSHRYRDNTGALASSYYDLRNRTLWRSGPLSISVGPRE